MSNPPGKLLPADFLSELQQELNRTRPTTRPGTPGGMSLDLSELAQRAILPPASGTTPPAPIAPAAPVVQHSRPAYEEPLTTPPLPGAPPQLSALFDRVNSLLGSPTSGREGPYAPTAPETLDQAGLTTEDVERLTLKFLLVKGSASGRTISAQICLPFNIIDPVLKMLKQEQILAYKGAAAVGDYDFVLTDLGRDRARRYSIECSYFGSAPVPLRDYLAAMSAQSIAKQHATREDLVKAFSDLLINPKMLDRLGPAVNSGRGMFLFGEPGNGKTSIAERITACFGSNIWIPKSLGIEGEIVRIYDPAVHFAIKQESNGGIFDLTGIDQRWIQVKRPTVIAGGELTMEELEVRQNQMTKICESPLQLKSNCGTLVIDDFGRQRMPVTELLNRWIVPLEKRYDFLNLPSGKKVQVPFDQLIIFSTNLEPKDLVDGAFLRRIPYKIEVPDPSVEEFRKLFELFAPTQGFQFDREAREAVEYLIHTHYISVNRPFRACQPRDLLSQVKNRCLYHNIPRKLTQEGFDFACENYFSVM